MKHFIIILSLLMSTTSSAAVLGQSGFNQIKQSGYVATGTVGDDVTVIDGAYAYLAAAAAVTVVSSDTNDTSAGTGCQTVTLRGLDGSYNFQTETVSTNGTGAVTTSGTWFRINKAICATMGSHASGSNIGNITVAASGTTYAYIPAGLGVSQQAIYSAPLDRQTYLASWNFSVGASTTAQGAVAIQMRPLGGAWQTIDVGTGNDSAGIVTKKMEAAVLIPKKADLRMRILSTGALAGIRVNGEMEIVEQK